MALFGAIEKYLVIVFLKNKDVRETVFEQKFGFDEAAGYFCGATESPATAIVAMWKCNGHVVLQPTLKVWVAPGYELAWKEARPKLESYSTHGLV